MSIYEQPNSYECGPFALKHALLALGIFETERRIARLAGTNRSGTDEVQLARVAGRFDCDLPTLRFHEPTAAQQALAGQLRQGNPVLLCVDQWEHWVTVLSESAGEYVVFDSAVPGVVRSLDWEALRVSWAFRELAGSGYRAELFDLHPLIPRIRVPARARLSVESAALLVQPDRCELARDWAVHAQELFGVCETGGAAHREPDAVVPLAVLLDGLGEKSPPSGNGGSGAARATRRTLLHLRVVAVTYGLEVRRDAQRAALRELGEVVRRLSR